MTKTPRKTKHWAEEAYDALHVAWRLLREEHPNPSEYEKLELSGFAPVIAGTRRGITGRDDVQKAYAFVFDRLADDLRRTREGELVHCSILFLLGYLDAHISFGVLSEKRPRKSWATWLRITISPMSTRPTCSPSRTNHGQGNSAR